MTEVVFLGRLTGGGFGGGGKNSGGNGFFFSGIGNVPTVGGRGAGPLGTRATGAVLLGYGWREFTARWARWFWEGRFATREVATRMVGCGW